MRNESKGILIEYSKTQVIFVMFIILINNQATYDKTADKNVELDQRQNSRETLGLCNF
jgi:hypothetical protein